jgi:hypothetical protein
MVNKQTAVCIEKLPIKNNSYHTELKYDIREVFDDYTPLSILKGLYVPTAKDKLFIFPNCNIPRFKVKAFCESTDTAVVKFKEKANIWFTNKENLQTELIEKLYHTECITKKAMLQYLNTTKVRCSTEHLQQIIKLIEDIESTQADFVIISYSMKNSIKSSGAFNGPVYDFMDEQDLVKEDADGEDLPLTDEQKELVEAFDRTLYEFESPEKEALYNTLMTHGNVYDESALLSLLNSELVMDQEIYEGVKNLFESNDRNDHKVAMESMANCNYLQSAVYLLLLMKDYKREMANSDMKNHVNFKSLLKFFDVNINYSELSYDAIVYRLVDKNIMTYENMALILPEAIEHVNDCGNSTYFKMTNVEPTDDIKKLMEFNKQSQVVVPEPIEEKPITDL